MLYLGWGAQALMIHFTCQNDDPKFHSVDIGVRKMKSYRFSLLGFAKIILKFRVELNPDLPWGCS